MDREHTESKSSDLHSALKGLLRKEVSLSRELLSNMRQEEVSLMLHDQGSLTETLSRRSHLLQQLSALRLDRVETTKKIAALALSNIQDIDSIEIASLNDQLESLTTRMTRELAYNKKIVITFTTAPLFLCSKRVALRRKPL